MTAPSLRPIGHGQVYPWEENLWVKVDFDGPPPDYAPDLGPCWLWTASITAGGYGQFAVDGYPHVAHRITYELLIALIPELLELDHLCRVRHCVNPWHLEPVTHAENARRGLEARRHCKNGHEFTPENTYHRPDYPTSRECLACRRDRNRRYYRRRKELNQ